MNNPMASPRAVVIPFEVPDDGRGLGLGLAALVHSFAQIDGESVALAQLLARTAVSHAEAGADVPGKGAARGVTCGIWACT